MIIIALCSYKLTHYNNFTELLISHIIINNLSQIYNGLENVGILMHDVICIEINMQICFKMDIDVD